MGARTFPPAKLPAPLMREIARILAGPVVRIQSLEAPGNQKLWLKRAERPTAWMRLTKGAGWQNFENDRCGLHALGEAGLPVAPILAEGTDFLVTPDLGLTLRDILTDPVTPHALRTEVLEAAGAALARLHQSGFSHGRPALRDICWNGSDIHFIDFERFSVRRTTPTHFAQDVIILIHSLHTVFGPSAEAEADWALAGYCAQMPAGVPLALKRQVRRLGWFAHFCTAALRFRPDSRELRAVPPTLRHLRRHSWINGAGGRPEAATSRR